ncbi:MAG: Serine/threonine-protein kinase PknD [Candidatus Celerinatantimonas neptuna]|nr:MAG: Serine/threonine-protein kinase PknD [Candidatus Celerinatantimonas neptuna]
MINPAKPNDEEIRQRFTSDRYELIDKMGEGGFSHVFLAFDHKNKQKVTIKISKLACYSDERKAQLIHLKKEYAFLSELSHPNIIKILDYGRLSDKLVYQVFRHINGITLHEYLKRKGPPDVKTAYHIMTEILEALMYIHQHQIVHQDIKPSNIIVSQTRTKTHITIIDFGISTRIRNTSQSPKSIEHSLGTPIYCPPEQLQGKPPTFGNDLYMWGAVYLECLTGMPPQIKLSPSDKSQKQEISIILPKDLLAHPLGKILRQILIKDPNKRRNNTRLLLTQLRKVTMANLANLPPNSIDTMNDQPPTEIIANTTSTQ